ncbi:MAG TPA: RDD family protein [Solirubrobacteraceae bacterium]|nr:RDD family protein [Solirubrobacteraceae bacterium]
MSPITPSPAEVLAPAPVYAGLITRAIAFAIDAALILAVQLLVSVAGVVIVGVLHLPTAIDAILAILGGCLAVLWSVGYLVAFWTTTGQTPGSRVMQIRVQAGDGNLLRPGGAVVRCLGLFLAALPLFAGFVPILFDRRRRGFQDWLAHTVVVHTPQLSIAAARRRAEPRIPRTSHTPRTARDRSIRAGGPTT